MWASDWCPRVHLKPDNSVKCEVCAYFVPLDMLLSLAVFFIDLVLMGVTLNILNGQ